MLAPSREANPVGVKPTVKDNATRKTNVRRITFFLNKQIPPLRLPEACFNVFIVLFTLKTIFAQLITWKVSGYESALVKGYERE